MVGERGVFIGLGSNMGNRARHLRVALLELSESGDIEVVDCSSIYETEPVGGPPGQPPFLNAVAELATSLTARELLVRLLEVERRHGRERFVPGGARTLDLDLLLFRDQVINEPDLEVPHPRMWQRCFVMDPLAEICDLERLVSARRLRGAQGPERTHCVSGSPDGSQVLA